MLYGGIEAGGTKFVCGIGNEQLQVIERKSFPTYNTRRNDGASV